MSFSKPVKNTATTVIKFKVLASFNKYGKFKYNFFKKKYEEKLKLRSETLGYDEYGCYQLGCRFCISRFLMR